MLDLNQAPLPGARVRISFGPDGPAFNVTSDSSGTFRLGGIPPGSFSIRVESQGFKPYEDGGFLSEPAASVSVRVTLVPLSSGGANSSARIRPSLKIFSETTLSREWLERFPTGNNIWNLVENFDLSATSNRIDVGGLWTGVPGLFSGRGSSSWTQSRFLLNGMDLTDPYLTGTPLFYPDVFGWSATRLVNADFPVQSFSPGAYFDTTLTTESPRWRGGLAAYYSDKALTSRNITPALENEGLFDSHYPNRLGDFHSYLTGPLSKRASLFVSVTSQSVSRHMAEFAREDRSSVLSGLAALNFSFSEGSHLRVLWTGQAVHNPFLGAGRKVDPAATLDARNTYHVFQALWDKRLADGHSLRAGVGLARGSLISNFQSDAQGFSRRDLFLGQVQGAAAQAGRATRSLVSAFLDGQAFLGSRSSVHHLLQYGLKLQYAESWSRAEIRNNLQLIYFKGQPLQVVRFNGPAEHREAAFHANLYGQETLVLGGSLSLTAGLNLGLSHGWVPGTTPAAQSGWETVTPSRGGRITWLNLSPRLAATLPLSRVRNSFLRISAARTYYTLPLSYLTYGHPGALGGLVFSWQDANGDTDFQDSEAGPLVRRQGPLFGSIDPNLKRPSVDELMIALNLDLGKRWILSVAGFLRETRNLVAALNTGVPFSAYDPQVFSEAGDNGIAGDYDDLTFTLFNQKQDTLGQDFFLLTNADAATRVSRYRGADITLVKRPGGRVDFFLSIQAIEAVGLANPGNSEWENDDGLIGSLYSDPNTLINARGRLRFDRGYTVRLGLSFETIAGIRLGTVIKYYDGQPFARQIIITGFNQGPFYIMAHPRGVARYEYNRTVDLRLDKEFRLGAARLRLLLDGFNIFNRNLATQENEWTGSGAWSRAATEIQSPRSFRLGCALEF